MTAPALRTALREHPLFRPLDDAALEPVVARARRQALDPGEILFHQGSEAERFFVLEQGLVKLARSNRDGQEKVVHLVRSGESFAEAVMFMNEARYPVTAEALERGRVIGIPNDAYRAVLRASPEACMGLLADLSMRLHHLVEDIDQLTLQQSRPRVARYLLAQVPGTPRPGDRFTLAAPKRVMASRLSMTPETFSRTLHEFAARGLVTVTRRTVTLDDPETLRILQD